MRTSLTTLVLTAWLCRSCFGAFANINTCTCVGGTPARNSDCTTNKAHICKSCEDPNMIPIEQGTDDGAIHCQLGFLYTIKSGQNDCKDPNLMGDLSLATRAYCDNANTAVGNTHKSTNAYESYGNSYPKGCFVEEAADGTLTSSINLDGDDTTQPCGSFSNPSCICTHDCAAGKYGDYTKKQCQDCPTGRFSHTTGARIECTACPTGWSQSSTGQTSCVAYTCTCASGGTGATGAACTSQNAVICGTCHAGKKLVGGSCETCPDGYHQASATGTSCTTHSACGVGKKEKESPSSTQDRVCDACEEGRYQDTNTFTETSCTVWSTCVVGKKEEESPSSTQNRVCVDCKDGRYQDTNTFTETSCTDWSTCGAGEKQSVSPTLSRNRVCVDCDAGRYQISTSHTSTSCTVWSTCVAGKKESVSPLLTRNRACVDCAAGKYQISSTFTETSCVSPFFCFIIILLVLFSFSLFSFF